jgi:hypothetical protein
MLAAFRPRILAVLSIAGGVLGFAASRQSGAAAEAKETARKLAAALGAETSVSVESPRSVILASQDVKACRDSSRRS